MNARLALPLLLLASPPAAAQVKHSAKSPKSATPAKNPPVAAGALPADSATAAPSQGFTIETPGTAVANPSLDTPIGQLVGDPRTKAVLDKDLPGLSDDKNLAKFSDKSLRQFQPLTGGQLTDTLLRQTGDDLKALGTTPAAVTEPEPAPAAAAADHTVEQKGEAPPANASADEDKPR